MVDRLQEQAEWLVLASELVSRRVCLRLGVGRLRGYSSLELIESERAARSLLRLPVSSRLVVVDQPMLRMVVE